MLNQQNPSEFKTAIQVIKTNQVAVACVDGNADLLHRLRGFDATILRKGFRRHPDVLVLNVDSICIILHDSRTQWLRTLWPRMYFAYGGLCGPK
jgi:hypothetical protein